MLSVYRDFGVVPKEGRSDNLNKTAENRSIYQLVHPGWLVVNRMKAFQGSVGISEHRGIVSGHYLCFRPRHEEDPNFLNLLLRSAPYIHEYRRMSRGVRPNQVEIDNDELRVLPLYLPPLSVQRDIAAMIGRETAKIDALIAKQDALVAALRDRRESAVMAAVTGGAYAAPKRDSGVRWIGEVPQHWQVGNIRRYAAMHSGHTPSRQVPEYWEDCHISTLMAVPAAPFKPSTALRATARQMRRRLEVLRAAPRWLHACADGDESGLLELDLRTRASSRVPPSRVQGDATRDALTHGWLHTPDHLQDRRCQLRHPGPATGRAAGGREAS